jgi:Family of unknown function (DUF5681)
MKRTRSTRSYEVGYGKPPKTNQFRKGRSGNPRGRTPGQENLIAVFKRVATKRVRVSDNGVVRTLSMAEAVIAQNVKAALNQDQIAMGNIFRLAEQAGEFKDWNDPAVVGKPLFLPSKMSTDEALAFYGANVVNVTSSRTSVPRED